MAIEPQKSNATLARPVLLAETIAGRGIPFLIAYRIVRTCLVMAVVWTAWQACAPAARAQSFTSSIKQGFQKIGQAFTPSPKPNGLPSDDPTSLANKTRPGPELYLAMARMYEQSNKLDLAERQYKEGLRLAPKDLALQLGYARLKDRLGETDTAIKLYQDVARQYPEESGVYNDLGLCYARRGMLVEAVANLERAIQIKPDRKLYRNNLATILVEMGRTDAALVHLKAAHPEAIACYNLAYLLQKKGQPEAAVEYFRRSLEKDPSLDAARAWLERLGATPPGPLVITSETAKQAPSPAPMVVNGPPHAMLPPAGGAGAPQVFPPSVQNAGPVEAGPYARPPEQSPIPRPLPPVDAPLGGQAIPKVEPQRSWTGLPGVPQEPAAPAGLPRAPVPLPPVEDAPLPDQFSTPNEDRLPTLSPPGGPTARIQGLRVSDRRADPILPRAPLPSSGVRPLPPVEDAPLPP